MFCNLMINWSEHYRKYELYSSINNNGQISGLECNGKCERVFNSTETILTHYQYG